MPNMSPMQMMQMLRQGGNPQQAIMKMMSQQANNNPIMANLLQLAQNGNGAEIEKVARNLLQGQGYDFDKEFKQFTSQLGL